MPYAKRDRVEREFGKPMHEVLDQLYRDLGSTQAVAERLGVTPQGLNKWLRESGCKAVLRIECAAPVTATATRGDGNGAKA